MESLFLTPCIRIVRWISSVDLLLRGNLVEERVPSGTGSLWRLVACTLIFGGTYGFVMGTFSGLASSKHLLQLPYSAIKVPLLLLLSFLVGIPSYFVLNSLCGLRQDFHVALRALAATQAGLTIILASLAPFTIVWYLSSSNYSLAVAFNGLMFLIASGTAQVLLRRYYGPLIRRDHRHRWMLMCWMILYSFVAIQLAWVLRPFVGDPRMPPEFFRSDVFQENAYQVVLRLVWRALSGQ